MDRLYPLRRAAPYLQSARGVIATANSRITPDGYKYSISTGWEAPWRSATHLSRAGVGQKVFRCRHAGIADRYLFRPRPFRCRAFRAARSPTSQASAQAKWPPKSLRAWDGRMTADSAAPAIAFKARSELMRLLLEPKLGVALPASGRSSGLNWTTYRLGDAVSLAENVLQQEPKRWLPPSLYQLRRAA